MTGILEHWNGGEEDTKEKGIVRTSQTQYSIIPLFQKDYGVKMTTRSLASSLLTLRSLCAIPELK